MRKKFFSDLSCTHGRTCVYGRYAPGLNLALINRLTCSARALIKLICIRECFDSALTGFDYSRLSVSREKFR